MLLVDSVFINNGGGLVLLKNLVDFLNSQFKDIYYLFDKRTEAVFQEIPVKNKKFIFNSMLERHFFYQNNKDKFIVVGGGLNKQFENLSLDKTYNKKILFCGIDYLRKGGDKAKK